MSNINVKKATKNKDLIEQAAFYISELFEQDLILQEEKEYLLKDLYFLSDLNERQEKIILNNVLEDYYNENEHSTKHL